MAIVVAVGAGALLCAASGLGGDDLLCLAPALLLMATLLARRYPGERLLLGLARPARKRRLRPRASSAASFARTVQVPRGGLLMGFALAVRPPPGLRAPS